MIFSLDVKNSLPEGWTPLEALAVVKCLDEKGDVALYVAETEGLSRWESVGMLASAGDLFRREMEESFEE